MAVPLQTLRASPEFASRKFTLPHGWFVEEKPRPSKPKQIDRYYYEPGTGHMFRSLLAVERYLRDGKKDASPAKVSKGSVNRCKQIIPFTTESTSNFILPDGWIVEQKERREGASAGVIDKHYVEPGTGQRFRSLRAVQRHLKETNGDALPLKLSFKSGCQSKNVSDQIELTPVTPESNSNSVLPDGWIIEKKKRHHRSGGKDFDKFYIEPETGNRFRSLRAVERHLKEAKEYTMTLKAFKSSHKHNISSISDSQNECVADEIGSKRVDDEHPTKSKENTTMPKDNDSGTTITTHTIERNSNFVLPDGWIIQKKQRKSCCGHKLDKSYIEPETGHRFLSLRAVERHLKEAKEYTPTLKAFKHSHKHNVSSRSNSQNDCVPDEIQSIFVDDEHPAKSKENTTMPKEVTPGNDSGYFEHSDLPKKSNSGEEIEASMDGFLCPPSTINWVLAGPGGDMWNPFVGEFMVPDSMKQKWSETFISSLHDENSPRPGF